MDEATDSSGLIGESERAARQMLVVSALAGILPDDCILYRAEETLPYECDALTAYRQVPLAVAMPKTEAQAAAVLKACHALNVPTVARGAGTGRAGKQSVDHLAISSRRRVRERSGTDIEPARLVAGARSTTSSPHSRAL